MNLGRHLLIGVTLLCILPRPAAAVAVLLKGSDTPVYGYLKSRTAAFVVIETRQADGSLQQRQIRAARINDVIVTVSQERLTRLDCDHPEQYRDYAEELAERRRDPEARDMAIRLYLIAAYKAPQRLGPSCLLGMAQLAYTPAEKRRYRAMAYLLDPKHPRQLISEKTTAPARDKEPLAEITDSGRAVLLKAIHFLRTDRGDEVRRNLDRSPLKEALGAARSASREDFAAAAKGPLSPRLQAKLAELEIELRGLTRNDSTGGESPAEESSWAAALQRSRAPAGSLHLLRITDFDPRKCEYAEGRWHAPNQ